MYRELIEKLIEGHSWAKLQAPCSEKDITKAEKFVGFSFPEELKALLRETNGDRNFLLSAEEIISNTKNNREIFPEFLEAEEYASASTSVTVIGGSDVPAYISIWYYLSVMKPVLISVLAAITSVVGLYRTRKN